jgi:hypothetical protein
VHTHKKSFVSSLSPGEILGRFRQISAEKAWTLTPGDGPTVHAQTGFSLKSAGEDIEVSAEAKSDGTRVTVVVAPRLGRLQLIDWGEGAKFQREILDRLGEPRWHE